MDRSARGAIEDGAAAGMFADQDKEGDGGHHEKDGSPRRKAGEQVGGPAGTEGGLRSLTTEGAGEIGTLPLLQEDNRDKEERDDDVNDGQEDDHANCFLKRLRSKRMNSGSGDAILRILSGAEGGT